MAEQEFQEAQAGITKSGITRIGAAMGAPGVADLAGDVLHVARPDANAIEIVDLATAIAFWSAR